MSIIKNMQTNEWKNEIDGKNICNACQDACEPAWCVCPILCMRRGSGRVQFIHFHLRYFWSYLLINFENQFAKWKYGTLTWICTMKQCAKTPFEFEVGDGWAFSTTPAAWELHWYGVPSTWIIPETNTRQVHCKTLKTNRYYLLHCDWSNPVRRWA